MKRARVSRQTKTAKRQRSNGSDAEARPEDPHTDGREKPLNNDLEVSQDTETQDKLSGVKDDFKSRDYIFTINNYTDSDLKVMDWLETEGKEKINIRCLQAQREVGKEGTPHIQGFIYFKSEKLRRKFKELFGREFYCKKPKSKEHSARCRTYCDKDDDTYVQGSKKWIIPWNGSDQKECIYKAQFMKECEEDYANVVWKPWQQECIDYMKKKPDGRTVYWFWEETGNVGKTFLGKYQIWKKLAIPLGSTYKDGINGMKNFIAENQDELRHTVIIDCKRETGNKVSAGLIEGLIDGYFFNTKYEACQVYFGKKNVIIFANEPPNYSTLSMDRWKVTYIGEPKKEEKDSAAGGWAFT